MKKIRLLSLITYTVVAAALAVTTFLSPSVYGTVWFFTLWILFAAALIAAISLTGMRRHAGRMILHVSFLAILGGGLMTRFTQKTGTLRLNTGETKISFVADGDGQEYPLPKAVMLDRFEVDYYPGGVVPRNYISHLIVSGKPETVSMNKILDLDGYRLLQASYDSSGATVLSVNHDPYGITLSYAGYALFAIGGIILLAAPKGTFRKLLRTLGVAFFAISFANSAGAAPVDGVPRTTADSLRSREVLYQGRVVCFNTLARDVVTKLYGKPTYRGLTPEQTLLSLRLFPAEWKSQPIIRIKDKNIRDALGINTQYASMSQLFDSLGNYRVARLYSSLGEKKKRAVEELDEKVGIILSLYSGDLIVTPPSGTKPLSSVRINAELAYNAIPFTSIIFVLLLCGFVAGMLNFLRFPKGLKLARMLLAASFAASLCCFSMQWYLSGRLPLANTFETLQFVVLMMQALIICAARRDTLLLPLGMLLTGTLAFVVHLLEINPVVTPLMPVLHSGWLSLHVSLVMTAYAILCFTFAVSSTALILRSSAERLQKLSLALLYPGVFLLGLGIFTGAVWANVSWGQYWSWDPKETWALVTMLIYALPLHKGIPFLRNPRIFHTYLLLAILSVAMTYFGVNHLNSLHAYN